MDLAKERQSLVAQRDNAWAVYHQAIGAIAFIDAMQESQKSMTLGELGEAFGAKEIGEPEEL
jgi:hypothetical protein